MRYGRQFRATSLADDISKAHHAVTESVMKILRHFDPALRKVSESKTATEEHTGATHRDPYESGNPLIKIVGFSATLGRRDKIGLEAAFDEIVYHK